MSRDGNLRILLREHLPDGDWLSVETGGTASGVPDSNFCFPGGVEGWVEGKQIYGWKVNLRPAQVGWIARRSRKGGRVFLVVRRNEDELYVIDGRDVEDFARQGFDVRSHGRSWTGGPKRWNWAEIRQVFTAGTV